jgi:two-component system, OmpR family, alkaline phosphatase synthesis response regulator PhoP
MKSILLVEDDEQITNLLVLHLHEPLYKLATCDTGAAAMAKVSDGVFDLVILDIMLPDLNGIEICRRIRAVDGRTPILMLSSLSEETDKVTALELGADDYLTKPFGIFELMARVKALLRRQGDARNTAGNAGIGAVSGGDVRTAAVGDVKMVKDLVIDHDKHKVTIRGERLELTPKEFDLLWLMASHPGKTFSRHELLELIWGFAFQEYEHTVTSHINRLRIKLEKNLNKPEYILTTWGTGYRFAE